MRFCINCCLTIGVLWYYALLLLTTIMTVMFAQFYWMDTYSDPESVVFLTGLTLLFIFTVLPRWISALDPIALLCRRWGLFVLAEILYKLSLGVWKSMLWPGPRSFGLPIILGNLADCASEQGRTEEAVLLYEEGLKHYKGSLWRIFSPAGESLSRYAAVLSGRGQKYAATELLESLTLPRKAYSIINSAGFDITVALAVLIPAASSCFVAFDSTVDNRPAAERIKLYEFVSELEEFTYGKLWTASHLRTWSYACVDDKKIPQNRIGLNAPIARWLNGRAAELEIKAYNRAISLNPKDITAYFNRGNSYDKLGQHQKAVGDYNKVVSLDPKLAMNYIGSSVLEMGTRCDNQDKLTAQQRSDYESFAREVARHLVDISFTTYSDSMTRLAFSKSKPELAYNVIKYLRTNPEFAKVSTWGKPHIPESINHLKLYEWWLKRNETVTPVSINDVKVEELVTLRLQGNTFQVLPVEVAGKVESHGRYGIGPETNFRFKFLIGTAQKGNESWTLVVDFRDMAGQASSLVPRE